MGAVGRGKMIGLSPAKPKLVLYVLSVRHSSALPDAVAISPSKVHIFFDVAWPVARLKQLHMRAMLAQVFDQIEE